ncbi:MAG: GWxTD domain-containing protein [Chlorobi bacterium]|nr:GWxTD domain-containing protein [Chlorobiota bacterium]
MIKKIFISIILLSIFIPAFCQENNLKAFFYSAPFNIINNGPYLETYIAISGESAVFAPTGEDGLIQANIEVTMLFKQNGEIKDFRKYNLKSPVVYDTIEQKPNFIDLQRIPLDTGAYNFELILKDINKENSIPFKYNDVVTINFSNENVCISGIELVENYEESKKQNIFSKNGYDIVPFVSDFFPNTINKLIFYAEIYNTDKLFGPEESYLLKYYIESFHTTKALHGFSHFKKQIASPVNVIFKEMNIENLPTGNFNLVIEVRDKKNKLVKNIKYFFQRSNPGTSFSLSDLASIDISKSFVLKYSNVDTLKEYIRCLRPISDVMERTFADNQLKAANIDLMQKFFLNFWEKRNSNFPEQEWLTYQKQVNYVNKAFSTQIMKGYETDRGRVYLQYGTPNTITDKRYEIDYYPYEIWHYYHTQGQTNRKFVFYKPGLAVNDYQLIHSNAKGEVSNQYWGKILMKDFTTEDNNQKQKGGVYDDYNFIR